MSEVVEKLSKMHLFKRVSLNDLENLVESCETNHYRIGEVICKQGERALNAMILVSGRLEASVRSDSTIRHVGEIHPGEIFGEQGLFHSKGKRNATVIANRTSVCLTLSPNTMKMSSQNTAIAALEKHLIGTMARRIRGTNLAIQKAWKDAHLEEERISKMKEGKEEVQEEKSNSLLNKLRSLFGGK